MDSGLVTSAKLFLQRVAKDTGAQLFVGMHVRRTDYAVWLKEKVKGRLLSKMVGLNFKHFYFSISVKIKKVVQPKFGSKVVYFKVSNHKMFEI